MSWLWWATPTGQTEHLWNLWSAIAGGVIGSLAGGIPAWLLARKSSNEVLARDREQRRERDKALSYAVAFKLLTITSSIVSLYKHVVGHLDALKHPSHEGMAPWQVLRPMVGFTDEGQERFTSDEMAIYAAGDQTQFAMDAMLLARRHASSLSSFQTYCEKRFELARIMPAPINFDGDIGTNALTGEQLNSVLPYIIPLNLLAQQLGEHLLEDVEFALKVVAAFGDATMAILPDVEKLPSLGIPTFEEIRADMADAFD